MGFGIRGLGAKGNWLRAWGSPCDHDSGRFIGFIAFYRVYKAGKGFIGFMRFVGFIGFGAKCLSISAARRSWWHHASGWNPDPKTYVPEDSNVILF